MRPGSASPSESCLGAGLQSVQGGPRAHRPLSRQVIKAGVETTCKCHGVAGLLHRADVLEAAGAFPRGGQAPEAQIRDSPQAGGQHDQRRPLARPAPSRPRGAGRWGRWRRSPAPARRSWCTWTSSPSFRLAAFSPGTAAAGATARKPARASLLRARHNTQSRVHRPASARCACAMRSVGSAPSGRRSTPARAEPRAGRAAAGRRQRAAWGL